MVLGSERSRARGAPSAEFACHPQTSRTLGLWVKHGKVKWISHPRPDRQEPFDPVVDPEPRALREHLLSRATRQTAAALSCRGASRPDFSRCPLRTVDFVVAFVACRLSAANTAAYAFARPPAADVRSPTHGCSRRPGRELRVLRRALTPLTRQPALGLALHIAGGRHHQLRQEP